MKCPEELFESAPDDCIFCGHSKDSHGGEADYKCECGDCGFFEIDAKLAKSLEPALKPCYNTIYRWRDVNPQLLHARLPERVVRFVNMLGTAKGLEYERKHSISWRIERALLKADKALLTSISIGEVVFGKVVKANLQSIVIGVVKADPTMPELPAVVLRPSGLHYEVNGMIISNKIPKLNGIWSWPSLVCKNVVPVEKLSGVIEDVVGELPYKVAKEILGQ